ncbi:cyclic AMP-responsive element-binding protein 1 isoform X2 [Bacillus rossius redtenbacheri]|uniref:cyclic AMP-responsive element-binding protein 1 isoform X2 n=1 Tax=Bacillus rossius redtenbacheri TaxID=93214 RepID=UPI002FDE0059
MCKFRFKPDHFTWLCVGDPVHMNSCIVGAVFRLPFPPGFKQGKAYRPEEMDSMVEENGTTGSSGGDPLAPSPGDNSSSVVVTSVQNNSSQHHHLVAATSIVHLTLPTHVTNNSTMPQVQSVIQANQQSVIQTPANIQPVQIQKGNVILVSKPANSVIQTTQGSLQTLQVVDGGSDDSLSNEDDATKKRRDILTRRPSYRKILNDLGGGAEIAVGRVETSSDCDTNEDSELSSHSIPSQYQTHTERRRFLTKFGRGDFIQSLEGTHQPKITVIPAGALQLSSQGEGVQGLHTLTMTNATGAGGTIVQYAQGQDGQFFVPVVTTPGGGIGGGQIIAEDQVRKREMRLLKNREAARECRRKKKEYIKCLENRVAVLENQNKALIDELKSLKELYCQQKTE